MIKRRVKVQVTWTIKCRCGRRYTVKSGQTHRCPCGQTIRA